MNWYQMVLIFLFFKLKECTFVLFKIWCKKKSVTQICMTLQLLKVQPCICSTCMYMYMFLLQNCIPPWNHCWNSERILRISRHRPSYDFIHNTAENNILVHTYTFLYFFLNHKILILFTYLCDVFRLHFNSSMCVNCR